MCLFFSGGIYFKDLPANLLGSFVIGVFAASSTVGLKNDKALAVLPKRHSWQENLELQIGEALTPMQAPTLGSSTLL